MLNAAAMLVGPQDASRTELEALAGQLAFTRILPFAGVEPAEREAAFTPLVFFLCSSVADTALLKPVADALRHSSNPRIRYAPLIYFAHAPSIETIKACIGMGFDDVIALPCPPGQLRERVGRQMGRPQVYTEVGSYFGPDRSHGMPDHVEPDGGPVRRIEIMRNVTTGIEVLQDEVEMVV